MNLGKTLQNLRKDRNISQEEIAETLKVSRQTISNWENSRSYPDFLSLMTLCDIYKISMNDLLNDDQELLNSIKSREKKKNKLIFVCITIIVLSLLLFVYLFFLKTYFYNLNNIKKEVQMIVDNNDKFIEIKKSKLYNTDDMTDNYVKINDSQYKYITSYLDDNNYKYGLVYRLTNYHSESTDTIGYVPARDILHIKGITNIKKTTPYSWWTSDLDIVRYDDYSNFFESNIIGNFPLNNNEIMISNVLANLIINNGISTTIGEYYPENYDEIINFSGYYYFRDYKIKICGIIDYDLSEFADLKNISWNDLDKKYHGVFESYHYKIDNIYNKVYVNKQFVSEFSKYNKEKINNIWQAHMTRTGIAIVENNKTRLIKLFKKFNTNPYFVKSTYSILFDKE